MTKIEGLTVAQLRTALAALPDDLTVVLAMYESPDTVGFVGEVRMGDAFDLDLAPFDPEQRVVLISWHKPPQPVQISTP